MCVKTLPCPSAYPAQRAAGVMRGSTICCTVSGSTDARHICRTNCPAARCSLSRLRALVHRPALLLADEPTGNVNPAIGRSILQTLRDTVREESTSVLLVTHSPEHAAWADRICFLKDGVIAGSVTQTGGPENLAPIYAELQRLGI